MRSSGVHHVDLVVSSIERSLPFYRELLGPLGYTRIGEVEGERGETIWYLGGAGCADRPPRGADASGEPYDRYRVGLHHVAFEASSRGAVDERARLAASSGARDRERSRRSTRYIPGYYAVFFYDPDGIKLEIVHVPACGRERSAGCRRRLRSARATPQRHGGRYGMLEPRTSLDMAARDARSPVERRVHRYSSR